MKLFTKVFVIAAVLATTLFANSLALDVRVDNSIVCILPTLTIQYLTLPFSLCLNNKKTFVLSQIVGCVKVQHRGRCMCRQRRIFVLQWIQNWYVSRQREYQMLHGEINGS